MKEKEKNPMVETTDQVMKNYEQALRSGLRFQEEIWQSWCAMANQSPFGSDWQKRFISPSGMINNIAPMAQKQLEDAVTLMEKNAKLSAELMRKALEASQTPALAESQSKWMDFMKAALEAGRVNVEATMDMTSRAMGSVLSFVEKNAELVQPRAAKAA